MMKSVSRGTVVMIHGFLGTDDLWRKIAPPDAIAVGLPGHDTFAHPERIIDASARFEDAIANLRKRIPRGKIHLWGYSMGARVATWVALHHSDDILSLTLISGTPGISGQRERSIRSRRETEWQNMLTPGGMKRFVDSFERQPLFRTQWMLPPSVLLAQRRMRVSHDPVQIRCALSTMGVSAMPDAWQQIGSLRMPVRCVVGERDTVYRDIADRIISAVSDGHLICVSQCGHNPIIEAPSVLSRWLQMDRAIFG